MGVSTVTQSTDKETKIKLGVNVGVMDADRSDHVPPFLAVAFCIIIKVPTQQH